MSKLKSKVLYDITLSVTEEKDVLQGDTNHVRNTKKTAP